MLAEIATCAPIAVAVSANPIKSMNTEPLMSSFATDTDILGITPRDEEITDNFSRFGMFKEAISSAFSTGSFSGVNDILGQTTGINNTGGSKTEINIQNININTQDDPESIKTSLMNMFIELQEEVTPKTVSRTVGGESGTTSTSTNAQGDQYSQQQNSGNSGNQNPT